MKYESAEEFWRRIRRRYDRKLDSVEGADDSIRVTERRKIAVQISAAEGNQIQVRTGRGEKGLYVPPRPALKKLTFGADKNYVYDGTEDVTVPVYKGDVDNN